VEGTELAVIAGTLHGKLGAFLAEADPQREDVAEFTFGTIDRDGAVLVLNGDLGRKRNGFVTNSGHMLGVL